MNTTVITVVGVGVVLLVVVMMKSSAGKLNPAPVVNQARPTTAQTAITGGAAVLSAVIGNWDKF